MLYWQWTSTRVCGTWPSTDTGEDVCSHYSHLHFVSGRAGCLKYWSCHGPGSFCTNVSFSLIYLKLLCCVFPCCFFFLTIFQTHLFHHDIFSIADNVQHQQPTQEHLVTECDDNCWKQDYLTFCCLEDHFRYMGNFCIKLFFTVS